MNVPHGESASIPFVSESSPVRYIYAIPVQVLVLIHAVAAQASAASGLQVEWTGSRGHYIYDMI